MGVEREVDLPVGIVTLLFSDIEGSTRLLTQLGDIYGNLLADHHRLLREVWAACGGVEVGTEGDAFFVAFVDAGAAVEAATKAQQVLADHDWGDGVTLKVRMGVHTGRPKLRDGDYWGLDVHYAARLAAAAGGGQVLVSETTADLMEKEVELEDLGEHGLKDFPAPRRVFHLVIDGRSSDQFPPPRVLRAGRTNLPAQLSSFVGREEELGRVCSLLDEARLVTLVGPGGVGKTRLSLAAGSRLLDGSGDGVWLVELAALTEPESVARDTARVLGVDEPRGQRALESLVDGIRDRNLLLILDNCEHLIEAAAELASAVLVGCPNVFVVATSREPLGLPGERVFRVPSLSLPEGEDLSASEGVALFVERARERRPDFALDETNAGMVAEVVRRLDGMPLALELAAARLKSLAIGDLHARLGSSLRLLTGGSRTAAPRQQTLQALIDWSYELLSDEERTLLARLSVFAGGFELDAAEVVFTPDQIDELDVIEILGSLVDKSLVQIDDAGEHLRYRLLETVRQYATAKLSARGPEHARTRAAHRDHYLALAESPPMGSGSDEEAWIDRIELEHDNIRVALAFCLEDPDPDPGLRLAAAVAYPRYTRGRGREVAESLLQHLNRPEANPPTLVRARALAAAVRAVNASTGNHQLAAELAQEAARIASAAGDIELEGRVYGELSWAQIRMGQADDALESATRAVGLARRAGSSQLLGFTLSRLSWAQRNAGHEYRAALEEAAQVARHNGNRRTLATVLQDLGMAALEAGDIPTARKHLEDAGAMAREVNDFALTFGALVNLGLAAYLEDDLDLARTSFKDALRRTRRAHVTAIPYGLLGVALTAEKAQPERSAWLHGAVDRVLADLDTRLEQPEGGLQKESLQRLRVRMGDGVFAAQFAAGRASTTDEAVAMALQE